MTTLSLLHDDEIAKHWLTGSARLVVTLLRVKKLVYLAFWTAATSILPSH